MSLRFTTPKSQSTTKTSSGVPLYRQWSRKHGFLQIPNQGFGPLFGCSDVENVHAVVARRTFRSKNVRNTRGSDHSWRLRCRFASLHYTTGHYTTLHYTPVHYITLHYTPVHSPTLNYTTPHYITLNDIATQIDR